MNVRSFIASLECRLLIALLVLATSLTPVWAKTVRVNNNVESDPAKGIYSSLQECHDDARVQPGDVILVEGSTKLYEGLTCTKRLTIMGTGYFLTENQQTSANGLPARVGAIKLEPGAEGTTLIGLYFDSALSSYAPTITIDDVVIMRCYLTSGILINNSINSLVIIQNFFSGNSAPIRIGLSSHALTGVIVKNNYFNAGFNILTPNAPRVFANVENNIFRGVVQLHATSFRNNILISQNNTVNITSPVIEYNLTDGTQLSAWPNNQTFQESNLFVGELPGIENSPDGRYRIKPGSSYLTAGYQGSEPGIFGGNEPYVLSGLPPVPTIYELRTDAVASKEDGLKVNIKAKINP